MQLRFASFAVINSREDLHPQECARAGRTRKKGRRSAPFDVDRIRAQSACLRRNAGISISSMPLLASASTLAAAWVRALRQTLGVFSPV